MPVSARFKNTTRSKALPGLPDAASAQAAGANRRSNSLFASAY